MPNPIQASAVAVAAAPAWERYAARRSAAPAVIAASPMSRPSADSEVSGLVVRSRPSSRQTSPRSTDVHHGAARSAAVAARALRRGPVVGMSSSLTPTEMSGRVWHDRRAPVR